MVETHISEQPVETSNRCTCKYYPRIPPKTHIGDTCDQCDAECDNPGIGSNDFQGGQDDAARACLVGLGPDEERHLGR